MDSRGNVFDVLPPACLHRPSCVGIPGRKRIGRDQSLPCRRSQLGQAQQPTLQLSVASQWMCSAEHAHLFTAAHSPIWYKLIMTREAGDNEAIAPTFTNFGLLENLFVQNFRPKMQNLGLKTLFWKNFNTVQTTMRANFCKHYVNFLLLFSPGSSNIFCGGLLYLAMVKMPSIPSWIKTLIWITIKI